MVVLGGCNRRHGCDYVGGGVFKQAAEVVVLAVLSPFCSCCSATVVEVAVFVVVGRVVDSVVDSFLGLELSPCSWCHLVVVASLPSPHT